MSAHKSVLTTGEVAKICHVAPRTVSKWFDCGHLNGYRIPGSKDRRIPIEQLVRFMRAHGIPLDGLESGGKRVLVLDADPNLCNAIRTALAEGNGYEVMSVDSAMEAGAATAEFKPHVIIADVTLPDVDPKVITRFVRSLSTHPLPCLIGTATGLSDAKGQALLQEGFHGFLSKPFEARALVRLIEANSDAAVNGR